MSSILANLVDEWYDGKRHFVVGYLTFSGSYATGGLTLDFTLAGIASEYPPTWFDAPWYRGYYFEYDASTMSNNGLLRVFGQSGSASATSTITSNNTNVSDADTVTIGTQVYTFKTTLVPGNPGQVHISSVNADGSLLNLIRAINHSGTPGTDYDALTPVSPYVTAATSVTSHAFVITAINPGADGNDIATATTAGTLSWTGTFLSGGADSAPTSVELDAGAFPGDLLTFQVPFLAIFPQLI